MVWTALLIVMLQSFPSWIIVMYSTGSCHVAFGIYNWYKMWWLKQWPTWWVETLGWFNHFQSCIVCPLPSSCDSRVSYLRDNLLPYFLLLIRSNRINSFQSLSVWEGHVTWPWKWAISISIPTLWNSLSIETRLLFSFPSSYSLQNSR